MAKITLSRVSGYRRSHREQTTPIYSLYHSRSGSDMRSASASPLITQSDYSISPLPTVLDYRQTLCDFHEISRARRALQ